MDETMSDSMTQCIKNCEDCHGICLETVSYCLRMGGEYAEQGHLRLLLDCADACQAGMNFMLRGSELHGKACGLCADVCERLEQSCEKFSDDDEMRGCAEICRRCADSCREMAGA
jgi:hypothetical protein